MRHWLVILLVILVVSFFSFAAGCGEKAGEAIKKSLPAPEKLVYDVNKQARPMPSSSALPALAGTMRAGMALPPADGCYILLNNTASFFVTSDYEPCKDIFIAVENRDGHDAKRMGNLDVHRMLKKMGHPFDESMFSGAASLNVSYKTGATIDLFDDVRAKFDSAVCQEVEFLGIKLQCFNKVGVKPNNLKYIVPFFTVIYYTSGVTHNNAMAGGATTAYEFILDEDTVYVDATDPSLYGESFNSTKCSSPGGSEYGSANHQWRDTLDTVFVCYQALQSNASKIAYAGVMYHEAVHALGGMHSYSQVGIDDLNDTAFNAIRQQLIDGTYPITGICNNTGQSSKRDRDLSGVYGAHISYLFSMSENPILSCDERNEAYTLADKELHLKVCQHEPGPPASGYSAPVC